ncbi:MAG: bifunctional pyr operon transcriptional regulator/uracil phosphoribosyltransferase PyrR [Endomicrobium sp.]|jgi:pyrimidine operon attenuation protein/uracil phosphoribosyltransferase|nr:bifunctional pyr operon transcriptional regulator/uracil phosphoribosyltransferase PyrR [Endomicrobium sp.]
MDNIILDTKTFQNAVDEISEKIFNDAQNVSDLAIVGIQNKGVFLAKRILFVISKLADIDWSKIPFGTLDITLHRDDLDNFDSGMPVIKDTIIPFDMNHKNIVLIDDVLYTGRTVRAALDLLMDFGRPKSIQLAVLIDRGFRELPIEAKYIGVKYKSKEFIKVDCKETDGIDKVTVYSCSSKILTL